MRKILLLFALVAFSATFAAAQCTPNPIFANIGIPGFWPNPQQGPLPDGEINQAYNQTITVVVVEDTTIDLSGVIGFPVPPVQVSVNYQEVTGVTGMPNGITYACDTSSCTWIGGDAGCVKLSGTPTQAGDFVVDIASNINFDVPASVPVIGGTPQSLPIPGVGYDLYVDNPNGIEEIQQNRFSVAQNAPNPFSGITEIHFNTPVAATMTIEVHNIAGIRVFSDTFRANAGMGTYQLDASDLHNGVYFYTVSNGKDRSIHKMIVSE